MPDFLAVTAALLPVFIFLGGLVFLDGYKLVSPKQLTVAVVYGAAAALVCWELNVAFLSVGGAFAKSYGDLLLPSLEEGLKASWVVSLIFRQRLGFTVDAAIAGFATGAGFSVVENIWRLNTLPNANFAVWLLCGLGTALLHGTTTMTVAVITRCLAELHPGARVTAVLPGFLVAWLLHGLYNQAWVPPVGMAVIFIVGLPLLSIVLFYRSDLLIQRWLGEGFDLDLARFRELTSGNFSETPSGRYLRQIARFFPPETVVDIHCYLRVWSELSLRAKGDLLRQEAGLPVSADRQVAERFAELKALEHSIGRAGLMALTPVLPRTPRDFWQLHYLRSEPHAGPGS